MPKAWLIGLIIFSTYVVFSSLTYLSPYLSQVYVVPITLVTALSIIRTYVIKMVASPVAGIVTDKVGSSISVMFVGFIIMAVNCALFLVIPKGNAFMWFAVVNMVVLSALLFAFRGIYFASVAESKIPMKTTGAVVGFASFIGFSWTRSIIPLPATGWINTAKPATAISLCFRSPVRCWVWWQPSCCVRSTARKRRAAE